MIVCVVFNHFNRFERWLSIEFDENDGKNNKQIHRNKRKKRANEKSGEHYLSTSCGTLMDSERIRQKKKHQIMKNDRAYI